MEQSPYIEANSHSTSHETQNFMENEGSPPCLQGPAISPYPEPDAYGPHPSTPLQ